MPASRGGQGNTQVAGDRVVDRGHQRQPHGLQMQHAVAQALVVVNQVVLAAVLAQVLHHAPAKRVGFGEAAGQLAQPFNDVAHGAQVPRAQGIQTVFEQVQAGQLNQAHARVELGVRRAGDHIHRMPCIDQRLAQILDVYPLATGVGLAAIAQQGNPQWPQGERLRRWRTGGIGVRSCRGITHYCL